MRAGVGGKNNNSLARTHLFGISSGSWYVEDDVGVGKGEGKNEKEEAVVRVQTFSHSALLCDTTYITGFIQLKDR